VPYLFVPRGLSNIQAGPKSPYQKVDGGGLTATLPLSNTGVHAGVADLYAWGIHDANDTQGAEDAADVRDVGVQIQPKSFLCGDNQTGVCSKPDDRSVVFAINTYGQASNQAVNEFDIPIDVKGDANPEYVIVGVDLGLALAGSPDGRFATLVYDGQGTLLDSWVASAPMNGSTIEVAALASEIGLDPLVNDTRFTYSVNSFSVVPGNLQDTTTTASFKSHDLVISSGLQVPLSPGQSGSMALIVKSILERRNPQLGWLVVALDNANGKAQADEVPIADGK
jgi:hypothetical protein